MRYSANQTKLFYSTDETPLTELLLLMEVPEFGGTPEKIDVTVLSDTSKKYINGIKDFGDLVFKFLYDNTDEGNYRVLKGLADNDTEATFQLAYPDGTAHQFVAIPAVKMDAGAINGALTFTATMTMTGDVTMVEATNP